MTTTLRPGSIVRLSFDQGPRSYGLILTGTVTVRPDGTRVVPTVWGDRQPIDDLACQVDDMDAHDEVDGYSVVRLAETILVPLCEHVDTFTDEWGLACSEPGVPTSFDVPCSFDATHALVMRDGYDPEDMAFNLCDAHAAAYRQDLAVVSDVAI